MPRLQATRSRLADGFLVYDRGDADTTDTTPIPLHFHKDRKDFAVNQRWLPTSPGEQGGIQLSEWTWQNGQGGAGTTIETPQSYQAGSCDFGEFVNLRRLGVAQPSGYDEEVDLPVGTAASTTGQLWHGQVFGGHLYITTNDRYALKVTNATGVDGVSETDFGSGAHTADVAVFNGTGAPCLYVSDSAGGIQEFNGTTWTEGETGTERVLLAVPYWTIGDALATGGAAGGSGSGAHRLVGTHQSGHGFYHVSGDPKVAANWSAFTAVGPGSYAFPIRSLASSNRTAFFATGMGVYGVDELGYSPNLTKWVELNADTNFVGVWSTYWAGLIWFTTTQGMSAFDPNGQRVDLARTFRFGAQSGISEIFGYMTAMAPSEDGLYCAVYNPLTDTSYVGVLLFDGSGAYRWSMAEWKKVGHRVTYLQQITGADGVPRLFIGTLGAGDLKHLFVQDIPRSGDPEADYKVGGSFRPAPSWSLTLSRFNGNQPVLHTARRFMAEVDHVGEDADIDGNSIDFTVANDGGDFESQGTIRGRAVRNGRWNAQPKANTAQATSMQVRLDVTNAEDAPVVIRNVGVLYSSHPELSKVISFPAIIGEGWRGEDPRSMLQRVEQAQRAGPLLMDDYFGRRVEGTITIDNERIVPEANKNGFTVYADVTILVTRQVTRVSVGDTINGGYRVS